jgi:hypothetical protein
MPPKLKLTSLPQRDASFIEPMELLGGTEPEADVGSSEAAR